MALKKHSKLKTLFVIAIICGLIFMLLFYLDWRGIIDRVKASQFKASQDIVKIEQQLNLTDRGKNLLYALSPRLEDAEKFNNDCSNISGVESGFLLGCYASAVGQETITVFNAGANATSEQKELFDYESSKIVTVAHEMLHGAYERRKWLDISAIDREIQSVSSQIKGGCQSSYPLKEEDCKILSTNMANYTSLNKSELYARLGTEIYSDQLPKSLAKDYARFFKNNKNIVDRYRKIRQQEVAIKAKIENLRSELENEERIVNNLTNIYYSFPSMSSYYKTNEIINSYNQKVEEYNSLVKLYNSTFVEQLNSRSPSNTVIN